MTIHRKIVKVPTIGSRKTNDLRPIIADTLEQGVNYSVLEYDEQASTCIVELWCSDHEILKDHERKNKSALDKIKADYKLEELPSHPKSPLILGSISTTNIPESIDEPQKKVTFKGKSLNFIKKHKITGTHGKELDELVLDEG